MSYRDGSKGGGPWTTARAKVPPARVTSATVDVQAVRKLVDLAQSTALALEADKNKARGADHFIEVQLLTQCQVIDEMLRKIGV